MGGRSTIKRYAVTLLRRQGKKLRCRIRAWEKVKRLLNEEPDAIFVARHLSKRMTEILKADRRQR